MSDRTPELHFSSLLLLLLLLLLILLFLSPLAVSILRSTAHVELTVSQVKFHVQRLVAACSAAEQRQDHALCLAHDFERHSAQAARGEYPFLTLMDSLCLGYCPCLRWLCCPITLLKGLLAYCREKASQRQEQRDYLLQA